jgi:hypothetical protein
MRHAKTALNPIRRMAAILAGAGMLWIGSTHFLTAQTTASAPEEGNSADRNCSNAGVAGEWAYSETGTVYPSTGAVPFAAVATYTLDAGGALSGTATSSSAGTVANVTLKGTAKVNSDCTATLTAGVYEAGNLIRTASFDLVYVANASEALGIVTSLVLADGAIVPAVLTVDAKKHSLPRE